MLRLQGAEEAKHMQESIFSDRKIGRGNRAAVFPATTV